MIFFTNSGTDLKTPRRMQSRVIMPSHISTWLSQEE